MDIKQQAACAAQWFRQLSAREQRNGVQIERALTTAYHED